MSLNFYIQISTANLKKYIIGMKNLQVIV